MPDLKQLPNIAAAQRSPLVEQLLVQLEYLLEESRTQAEIIQQMRDEIAVLKGQKAKPKFKPSGMETETEPDGDAGGSAADGKDDGREGKRAGSSKRNKTQQLKIHQTLKVPPQAPIPEHARFRGYQDFVVQDLRIQPHNTRYRLEVWQTPDGERLLGELPADLNGGHFGPELRRYALYQHHHCQVTQALLHEQLCEWGIDISVGQINALLSGANVGFYRGGPTAGDQPGGQSPHHGGRFRGAPSGPQWLREADRQRLVRLGIEGTGSKSRINFLQLLHAGNTPASRRGAPGLRYTAEQCNEGEIPISGRGPPSCPSLARVRQPLQSPPRVKLLSVPADHREVAPAHPGGIRRLLQGSDTEAPVLGDGLWTPAGAAIHLDGQLPCALAQLVADGNAGQGRVYAKGDRRSAGDGKYRSDRDQGLDLQGSAREQTGANCVDLLSRFSRFSRTT